MMRDECSKTDKGVSNVSKTLVTKLAVLATLTGLLSGSAEAAKRLDPTRIAQPGLSVVSPSASTEDQDAIRTGPPKRIVGFGSWLTSNYEVDVYTSNYLWCDFEHLQLVSGFFAGSDNSVHALVTIKDRSGRLVYQAEDTMPVEAHAVNYVIADIGPLDPGFYRVFSRTIQKEKTAKQRFWIQVTPQSDALCVVPE